MSSHPSGGQNINRESVINLVVTHFLDPPLKNLMEKWLRSRPKDHWVWELPEQGLADLASLVQTQSKRGGWGAALVGDKVSDAIERFGGLIDDLKDDVQQGNIPDPANGGGDQEMNPRNQVLAALLGRLSQPGVNLATEGPAAANYLAALEPTLQAQEAAAQAQASSHQNDDSLLEEVTDELGDLRKKTSWGLRLLILLGTGVIGLLGFSIWVGDPNLIALALVVTGAIAFLALLIFPIAGILGGAGLWGLGILQRLGWALGAILLLEALLLAMGPPDPWLWQIGVLGFAGLLLLGSSPLGKFLWFLLIVGLGVAAWTLYPREVAATIEVAQEELGGLSKSLTRYFHPDRIIDPGWIIPLSTGEGGFEVGAGIPTGCLATPLSEVSFETFPAVARSCVYTYAECTGPTDGYAVWQHGPAIRTFRVFNGCGGTVFIHTLTR